MARILALSIVCAVGLAGCNGPFVLLPGGQLQGGTEPVPESWAFTDEIDTVQLETNPDEPYSVNIWVVALDRRLYVHAGANRATWVVNMEDDPEVRMGIEGSIYDLTSSRVEGQDEFDAFADAYAVKYGRRPRNENVQEAYLFRLVAR